MTMELLTELPHCGPLSGTHGALDQFADTRWARASATASVMYENEDFNTFSSVVNCNDVLRPKGSASIWPEPSTQSSQDQGHRAEEVADEASHTHSQSSSSSQASTRAASDGSFDGSNYGDDDSSSEGEVVQMAEDLVANQVYTKFTVFLKNNSRETSRAT